MKLSKKIINSLKALKSKKFIGNLNIDTTNVCNQNCPMCNALRETDSGAKFITVDDFRKIYRAFEGISIMSCSFSGGEPTLVPELDKIIKLASDIFPFGVNLNTNLFASFERIKYTLISALKCNARIDISFDGFGEIADKLRGGKNVSKKTKENIEKLVNLKNELKSSSVITIHTVLVDENLHQIPEIFEMSKKLGLRQTIAPVNIPSFPIFSELPRLTDSSQLEGVIKLAKIQPHIKQPRKFLDGIIEFTKNKGEKLCPYTSKLMRTYKIFVRTDFSVSICDRISFGNLLSKKFLEIIEGEDFKDAIKRAELCDGCWYVCFVEPMLFAKPWNLLL